MTQPVYRAGIIGLGFIGAGDQVSGDRLGQQVADLDGTHFDALSHHPRVQLVAGSSRDLGRRERFAQRTGLRTFTDWQQMLSAERLDIVSIATYAPSHAVLVEACARCGVRAIYCEKPIATRVSDASRMIEACAQSGSLLVINHNRRFHPHYRELARRVRAGDLGDLTGAWLNWGSGRLGNVGTHFIDAMRMLTGQNIRSVSASLDQSLRPDCRGAEFQDPGGWAMLRLEGGAMVHVHAPDYANAPAEVILQGTRGRARIAGGIAEIETWNGARETLPPVPADYGTSMDEAVREIINWLDTGVPVGCAAEESLRALEVVIACHASQARQAAWVELPLSGNDREREVHSG